MPRKRSLRTPQEEKWMNVETGPKALPNARKRSRKKERSGLGGKEKKGDSASSARKARLESILPQKVS